MTDPNPTAPRKALEGAGFAVAVLTGLFMVQRSGSARIGAVFGPVLMVWFLALAVLFTVCAPIYLLASRQFKEDKIEHLDNAPQD